MLFLYIYTLYIFYFKKNYMGQRFLRSFLFIFYDIYCTI